MMSQEISSNLAQELGELFDMKKAKLRNEKRLHQEATEAQKDIRLLTLMFRDEIPDISIMISENESILWDSQNQMLLYKHNHTKHVLEGASPEVRIRVRPFLKDLVKKAKSFFR
jgi:hypothetical protein